MAARLWAVMPRYYFHLYNDINVRDEEGMVLPDVSLAVAEAIRSVRSLASAEIVQGRLRLSDRIEIADESGTIVSAVAFRDAITIED